MSFISQSQSLDFVGDCWHLLHHLKPLSRHLYPSGKQSPSNNQINPLNRNKRWISPQWYVQSWSETSNLQAPAYLIQNQCDVCDSFYMFSWQTIQEVAVSHKPVISMG